MNKRIGKITKIICMEVVLVFLVLGAFGVYAVRLAGNHIESQKQDITELSIRNADTFAVFFESRRHLLYAMSNTLLQLSPDRWENVLEHARSMNDGTVLLLNGDKQNFLTGEIQTDITDEVFQIIKENGEGMTGPGYDPVTGVRVVYAYQNFVTEEGEKYYLLGCIALKSLYEKVDLSFYEDHGYSYIVDEEGYTVMYSKNRKSDKTFNSIFDILTEYQSRSLHKDCKLSDLETAVRERKNYTGFFSYSEEHCVVSVVPIKGADNWVVISMVPEDYLYQPVYTSLSDTVLLLAAVMICFGIMMVIYYKAGRRGAVIEEMNRQLSIAKNEAEQANQTKTDFLSRMSHDIRTPMNGIIGMLSLAKENDNPSDTVHCLDKMQISCDYLLNLINDILDMNKVESGKIVLHPEAYSKNDFLMYMDSVIQPMCEQKNITLHVETTENLNGKIPYVDKLRINQIFFNLVSNAVKFTPENGTVTIRLECIPSIPGKVILKASITDTGIGMSEEFQQHMFESFTQEEQTLLPQRQGSGLGLAIVKSMLNLMGGTITVKSRLNEGTTFTVQGEIPVVDAQPEQEEEQKGTDTDDMLAGKNILLVEDHPLNQEIARRLLEKKGMNVTLAENGQIAVNLFQTKGYHCFDAVLMDVRMPVMDGITATIRIREIEKDSSKRTPIIAMTANAFDEDCRQVQEAGMDAHISKPVDPKVLYECLKKQLI